MCFILYLTCILIYMWWCDSASLRLDPALDWKKKKKKKKGRRRRCVSLFFSYRVRCDIVTAEGTVDKYLIPSGCLRVVKSSCSAYLYLCRECGGALWFILCINCSSLRGFFYYCSRCPDHGKFGALINWSYGPEARVLVCLINFL